MDKTKNPKKKNFDSDKKINKNSSNKNTTIPMNINTNISIVMKKPNSNKKTEPKKEKEKENTNFKINNPKKYLNIVNDDCFHLEMNLKLLGFDKEFVKEKNSINNISANFNPFLK